MLRKIKSYLTSVLIFCLYYPLSRSWRIVHQGRPDLVEGTPGALYAHWHGDELLFVGGFSYRGMGVMTSWSADGQIMTRLLNWLGYHTVRGSSSRGGAGALKGLIDFCKRSHKEASIAVDGPRGPLHKVKRGIVKLAQQTGRPIVPGASVADRAWRFEKSWNKVYLPKPFSKCVAVYGAPIKIPEKLTPKLFEHYQTVIEEALMEVKQQAEEKLEILQNPHSHTKVVKPF